MAGNFTVNDTAVFNINETADEFAGKGYAVIASNNATQYSYGHPDKPISLFTSFLCEALTNTYIIREGKKSLYDINKLLFLFLEIWNKNNPAQKQSPIYRANIGGTIFFEIQDYRPYPVGNFVQVYPQLSMISYCFITRNIYQGVPLKTEKRVWICQSNNTIKNSKN